MDSNYIIIRKKLNRFLKKFYSNKIIIGLAITSGIIIFFGTLLLLIEYNFYLDPLVKKITITFYFIVVIVILLAFVILNILKYLGFIKRINEVTINKIVTKHFNNIEDKLINIIELDKISEDGVSKELVVSSLNQKVNSISKLDFNKSIRLSDYKILFYIIGLIGFLSSLVLIINSDHIKDSMIRLKNINVKYEKPSPFNYVILNKDLKAGRGDDFELEMIVNSIESIEDVYISYGGENYLMYAKDENKYSYKFNNLNNDINFKFEINNIKSSNYNLKVLSKPSLAKFNIKVNSPSYTGILYNEYTNLTEIVVPIGSICKYSFETFYCDSLYFGLFNDQNLKIVSTTDNKSKVEKRVLQNESYEISLQNVNYLINNVITLNVNIIEDDYPQIVVEQIIDSTELARIYFKGSISDDYGFSKLTFNTIIEGENDSTINLDIASNINSENFFYAFNFDGYRDISDKIEYYFEISDNDQINGSKSAISELFLFKFPSKKEKLDNQKLKFDNIEDLLSNSQNLTREIQEDLFDMHQKMLNNELSEWDRKESIKNIVSKKSNLEETLKEIQSKNEELNNYMNSFSDQNEELIKKQEMIQDLLEEVFSDELKELLDEFNKMMEEFNERNFNQTNENIEISLDDLNEQLDKNLELLRKMQIEDRLNTASNELDKLIKKQEELKEELNKDNKDSNLNDQNNLNERLEELEEEYSEIRSENEKLDKPLNLFDFKQEFDKIKEQNQNSISEMQKGKTKKMKESMQQSVDDMKNLSFMMKQMMEGAFGESESGENIADMIQILDNLIVFSFTQEEVIDINSSNNIGNEIHIMQRKLENDFNIVSDSLYALSKREPSVGRIVNKEIVSIKMNMTSIENDLSENRKSAARIKQQRILNSANTLALFMSEVIKNLQQQMANSSPGNQNCEKPGNNPNPSSNSMQSLKNMQKSLQQQMEGMMQMMKDGKKQGQMNSEMGKALSQQEMMQKMLGQMMNQGQVGSESYETLKMAEKLLNQVRQDILRNNISNNTINRQKEIMSRLLRAENAENEREIDKKRKSNTAEEQRISETAKYFENDSSNDNFEENLIRNKLVLKRYYQNKYQNYVNKLDSINVEGN